ncbi:hypothetical protein [Streptomyces ardesiacus]|uniref:hypothetical protein n=1 Tax=Streptomyces ardesiacus TaxID=285564 RepID=UPI003F49FCDB
MDLNTARARIHALLPILDNPTDADARQAELDQRIDDLIAAAQNPATDTPTVKFLPPRDATCASCGHSGADHHHGDTKCWANLPRTRQPNGTWSAVPICDCPAFRSA